MISIIRYYLALASLMAVAVHGQEEGFFLGSLRTLNHLVSGDVFLLSEKVLEIRGFSYDGTAPAAFFWLDTAPNPTSGGRIAADGSPSLGCAATTSDPELPSLSNVNQRVEFPGETTIRDYLGGSLSVWCEAFAANFGDLTFPTSIPETALSVVGPELECSSSTEADSDPADDVATDIPTFIPTPEGFNCEELNPLSDPIGNVPLQVRWRVNNNLLEIELIGRLPEGEYVGFGVSGSDEGTEMIGADAQVAVCAWSFKTLNGIVLFSFTPHIWFCSIRICTSFEIGFFQRTTTHPGYFHRSTSTM
jgi:Electron transfer DM13